MLSYSVRKEGFKDIIEVEFGFVVCNMWMEKDILFSFWGIL